MSVFPAKLMGDAADNPLLMNPDTDIAIEDLLGQRLLQGEGLDILDWLLQAASVRTLTGGEVLLESGQPNKTLFLVLQGQLQVQLDPAGTLAHALLGTGDCIGELSIIDGSPVSARVVAVRDCRLLSLDEEVLWSLINRSHVASRNLLYMLSLRVRKDNSAILRSFELQQLHEKNAKIDALTGLHNRRWLDEMLPRQVERAIRSKRPLCTLMIDADHFKRFNDNYGHLAGDSALRHIAEIIQHLIRPGDSAVRYGGEEFTVILPDTTASQAETVAQRLCQAVHSAPMSDADGTSFPAISVSIGLAQLLKGQSAAAMLAAADSALYIAKHEGRNRVILA